MVDINNLKKVLECSLAANLSCGSCGVLNPEDDGPVKYTIEAQKLLWIVDELIGAQRDIVKVRGSYEILKDAYENAKRREAIL